MITRKESLLVPFKLQVIAVHPLAANQLVQILSENRSLLAQPPVLDFDAVPLHISSRLFIVDVHLLPTELSRLLRFLRMRCRGARFLVLVPKRNYEENEVLRLLYLGVEGIMAFSDRLRAELPAAVDVILNGGKWAPQHLVRKYQLQMSSFRRKESRSKFCLTGRENQVFEMLVRRFSNGEIAEALGISERTVKFHVSNVFLKLGVRRRTDLVRSLLGYPTRVLTY